MKIRKKHLAILLGAAAATGLAAAVSYNVTKQLVDAALDRETPKLVKVAEKAAGDAIVWSKLDSQFLSDCSESSAKAESAVHENIEMQNRDGVKLAAHWFPCENAKRIIIAMHGWRSTWSRDFGMIIDFLHDSGCSVLYVEQQGQNNSGGDYMGFGMIERYDCLDWINWVNANVSSSLPIYLYGVSMGATTVLMATGLDLPQNVHGVIADCGFTSPYAIWKHVCNNNLHMSYGIMGPIADALCKKKLSIGTNSYSATEALKESVTPALFIHGTDDSFVPVKMSYENYKACLAPKRLFVVPGADHAMSYFTDRTGYQSELEAFWGQYDEYVPEIRVADESAEENVNGER